MHVPVAQRLPGAKQGNAGGQAARADLLLCLARLIRGAPPAAVRAQHAQLLPWVLTALQDAQVGANEQAVTALLLTVSEALMDPAGARCSARCCRFAHARPQTALPVAKLC